MIFRLQAEVIQDIKAYYEMNQEALDWINEMVTYNVKGGKMNRGISVVDCYETLVRQRDGRALTNKVNIIVQNVNCFVFIANLLFDIFHDLSCTSVGTLPSCCSGLVP